MAARWANGLPLMKLKVQRKGQEYPIMIIIKTYIIWHLLYASRRVLPCWTSYNPLNSPMKWVHLRFSDFIVFCVSGSDKELSCNAGDLGSIPGLGREGNGYPLQCSCLENSMDRGAWWATVHGVMKSRTQLWLTCFSNWSSERDVTNPRHRAGEWLN